MTNGTILRDMHTLKDAVLAAPNYEGWLDRNGSNLPAEDQEGWMIFISVAKVFSILGEDVVSTMLVNMVERTKAEALRVLAEKVGDGVEYFKEESDASPVAAIERELHTNPWDARN